MLIKQGNIIVGLFSWVFEGLAEGWKPLAKYQISLQKQKKTHFFKNETSTTNSKHLHRV